MKASHLDREAARSEYLHRTFVAIEQRIADGATLKSAITWAHRRRSRFHSRGRLARPTLYVNFYRWRAVKLPETLVRNFHAPDRRCPVELVLDLLNRIGGPQIIPVAAALRAVRVSWEKNENIPGCGCWVDYVRRHGGDKAARRVTPPRFPFGKTILYAYLAGDLGREFQERLVSARRAQRELESFSAYIDARKRALEKTIQHQPMTNLSSSKT